MAATVQTVRQFSLETGISVSKVKSLIKQGVIPEIPREGDTCLQLVNKMVFDAMVEAGQLVIPLSETSVKRIGRNDDIDEDNGE